MCCSLRNHAILIALMIIMILPSFAMAKKPPKETKPPKVTNSNSEVRPDWVDAPKSEYPDGIYLSAVGSAGSRADAENAAIGNLAKIFRSDVTASTSYQERYNELMVNSKANSSTETNSQKTVNVKTKQSLMNIEIGKSWTDKLGQTYALAYIHRLKTAEIYEQQIEENSSQIRSYLDNAKSQTDSWRAFAFYSAAALINTRNEELLGQLAIISADTKQSIELGYSAAEMRQKMAELAKSIVFTLSITGDIEGKVKAVISEILTNYGFTLADREGVIIDVNLSFEDVDLNQKQKFVRYTLALNIYDADGNTVLTLTDNSREGHLNQAEAKARAIRTLNNKIKSELPKRLNKYFDGLISGNK